MTTNLLERLSSTLRTCFTYAVKIAQWLVFYSPPTWLLVGYPHLAYSATLAKRYSDVTSGRRKGMLANGQAALLFDSAPIIYALVLLPSCYLVLSQYSLLHSRSSEGAARSLLDGVPDALLQTDPDTGLTEDEALARQQTYGLNELQTETDWIYFLRTTLIWPRGASNLSLGLGGALAAYLGDWLASFIMIGLWGFNAGVSIYQTEQADEVLASLAASPSLMAKVLREGRWKPIEAAELVPGDIIHLEAGETIPAECRVVKDADGLQTDQSAITGDSIAADKSPSDMCYYTTGVKSGSAIARVVATAPNSFVGRTAKSVSGSDDIPRRRGQKRRTKSGAKGSDGQTRIMQSIGTVSGIVMVVILAAVFVNSGPNTRPYTILELCVALAIASLPNGINIKLTTIRAQGAAALSQQKAIAQSVGNVELLAGVDVLCVDKTGTMTQNDLRTSEPYSVLGTVKDVVLTAGLASKILASESSLDLIDKSCAQALETYEIDIGGYRLVDFKPFNPEDKIVRSDVITPEGERITCVKGAPRAVLNLCEVDGDAYTEKAAEFARRGLRALGVARKTEERGWDICGLVTFDEPPRTDTLAAVRRAEELGVSTKLLTSDANVIANEFAQSIGLEQNTVDAETLLGGDTSISARLQQCEQASVFSEVFPEHKNSIVQELQRASHCVAITGDGANDAPALRTADVGIAVEGSSEAAMSAADLVFLADGLSTIVTALQMCRQIFELLHSFLLCRTAVSLHLLALIAWEYAVHGESLNPMLPLLVLHCNELGDRSTGDGAHQIPFSKGPKKWQAREFWSLTIPLAGFLTVGAIVSLQTWSDSATPGFREQILFLHAVLSSSSLPLLVQTNGGISPHPRLWHHLGTSLLVNALATASCIFGIAVPASTLNLKLAAFVWLCSVGTIGAMAAWIAVVSPKKCRAATFQASSMAE